MSPSINTVSTTDFRITSLAEAENILNHVRTQNGLQQTVSIRSFLYRLVCANGMVLPRQFQDFSFRPSVRMSMDETLALLEHGITGASRAGKAIDRAIERMNEQRVTDADSIWLYRRLRGKLPTVTCFKPEEIERKTYYEILNEITARANETTKVLDQPFFQGHIPTALADNQCRREK